MRILKECYEEAKEILNKNRFALDRIAEYLIERETITGKEFLHILRDVQKEEDPDMRFLCCVFFYHIYFTINAVGRRLDESE